MHAESTVNAIIPKAWSKELYAFDKTHEQKHLHFQQTKAINNISEKNVEQNNQTEKNISENLYKRIENA